MDYGRLIIFIMLLGIIWLLSATALSFYAAKAEIAKYNERVLENCYILNCSVSFLGDVHCSNVLNAGSVFNFSSSVVELNLSRSRDEK